MFGKRIGFLKFKADIFCKETGQKVSNYLNVWLEYVFDFNLIHSTSVKLGISNYK